MRKNKTRSSLADLMFITDFQSVASHSGQDNPEADELRPEAALVVTKCGANGTPLLTLHHFERDGVTLGEGIPVDSGEAVRCLSLVGRCSEPVWLTPNMLSMSPTSVCWHLPPAVRPMLWKINNRPLRMMVPYPGLALSVTPKGFQVYAYAGKARPTPDTPLFHAPLPNVFDTGFMCWGNVEEPARVASNMVAFEKALIDTFGTHANHDNVIHEPAGNARENFFAFWRDLNKAKAKRFPEKRLVAAGMKLSEMLDD